MIIENQRLIDNATQLIVCWINVGTQVKKGERFGLIRFGSRVDVYLPDDSKISVKLGDKVRAGKTPLGYLS